MLCPASKTTDMSAAFPVKFLSFLCERLSVGQWALKHSYSALSFEVVHRFPSHLRHVARGKQLSHLDVSIMEHLTSQVGPDAAFVSIFPQTGSDGRTTVLLFEPPEPKSVPEAKACVQEWTRVGAVESRFTQCLRLEIMSSWESCFSSRQTF